MTGSLFSEARGKWRIGGAFALAVVVHLVAIGLAFIGYHESNETVVGLASQTVDVLIESASAADDLSPPPDIESPLPAPTPMEENRFTEVTNSPPSVRQNINKSITRIRSGTSRSASSPSAIALALSAPSPEYPAAARQNGITGDGIAVMTIDRSRGYVTHVSMWKSTGNSSLDDAAIRSFRRWRFRPGSVSQVKAPVTFRLTAQLD